MQKEIPPFDKNEFYIKWTKRLISEYQNICHTYSLGLKRPVIRIQSLGKTWGYFDSTHKEISINENLILHHSWDTVCMVLKHEMAHQIVHEVFAPYVPHTARDHSGHQQPHGDLFQKACDLLALPAEYRKASFALEQPIPHWKDFKNEESDLQRKIEKLLNLSQSSNEHEAALAMEKVQTLYEKYNIETIQNSKSSPYVSLVIFFQKKKVPSTAIYIANILQDHFFVDTVFSSSYEALSDTDTKTLVLLGLQQNVLMAEYVFYFLQKTMESLWKTYQAQKQLGAQIKLSYQKGILLGFGEKLERSKKARENHFKKHDQQGLIALGQAHQNLSLYVKTLFPRLSRITNKSSGVYKDHFEQGKADGKHIQLNKPIHDKGPQNATRFLGK